MAKKVNKRTQIKVPKIRKRTFNDNYFKTIDKKLEAQRKKLQKDGKKRKIAQEREYSQNDVAQDVQELGRQWQNQLTPEGLHRVMTAAIARANSPSNEVSNAYKLLAGTFEVSIRMRGMIWKLRPMVEDNGNKMTHIAAIQIIRGISNSIADLLPNQQFTTYKQYIHKPAPEFTEADRFRSVSELQAYLVSGLNGQPGLIETLKVVTTKLEALTQARPNEIYVYDNKWAWGKNEFPRGRDVVEFSPIGYGEKNLIISSLYEAQRDILVFAAYNHDRMINLAGELSTGVGIDAFGLDRVLTSDEWGMSDREKFGIIRDEVRKDRNRSYMSLKGGKDGLGQDLMVQAHNAMVTSISHFVTAYNHFNDPSTGGADNRPEEVRKYSDKGIENLLEIANSTGSMTVREPLTGKTASINAYAFYHDSPLHLDDLFATTFYGDPGSRAEERVREYTVKGAEGDLKWRNYDLGRSKGWSKSAWIKYVPSFAGQDAGYMMEAKRIISSSQGTAFAFGLTNVFVH
ncbi:MAG: hypothetical protein HRT45_01410 [Bdellovibrionales bacterium]|nr:hypothetical protein [Bdellovibrionales bacterium]